MPKAIRCLAPGEDNREIADEHIPGSPEKVSNREACSNTSLCHIPIADTPLSAVSLLSPANIRSSVLRLNLLVNSKNDRSVLSMSS